jgi:hypothetical protein
MEMVTVIIVSIVPIGIVIGIIVVGISIIRSQWIEKDVNKKLPGDATTEAPPPDVEKKKIGKGK